MSHPPVAVLVNVRVTRCDVFMGRREEGMHYGNPFSHKRDSLATVRVKSRVEAIQRHRTWLAGTTDQDVEPERRLWILQNLDTLRGKRLGCFCYPRPCHVNAYIELLEKGTT